MHLTRLVAVSWLVVHYGRRCIRLDGRRGYQTFKLNTLSALQRLFALLGPNCAAL